MGIAAALQELAMFSKLEPLLSTHIVRHTEASDTRQDIRHQDGQGGRKGSGGHNPDDPDAAFWEDRTRISVAALHAILEQLLHGQDVSNLTENSGRPGTVTPDLSGHPENARAFSAYRRASEIGHDPAPVLSHGEGSRLSEALSANEVRMIHRMIDSLSVLAQEDVEFLTLEKSESFLQSILDAIENARVS